MRKLLLGFGILLGLGFLAPTAKAQDGGFSDPFFLYYGYFLPRQNALAAQGQPEDFYRAQSVQRQAAAQTDRRGLYEVAGIGEDELDPLREFGTRSASTRMVATIPTGLRTTVSGRGHSAPPGYFARTASGPQRTYFPTLRSGAGSARSRPPLNVGSVGRSALVQVPSGSRGAR